MYNNILKERFINESTYSEYAQRAIINEFNNIEYYENILNKDLSNFSKKEICDYYKLKNSISLPSLTTINSYFITYTSFAINNNYVLDGLNHYNEISRDELFRCLNSGKKNNMYMTRQELYSLMDDPELDLTAKERFLILAIFEGILGHEYSELLNIRKDDIDTQAKTIKLSSGRVIPISAKFIGTVFEACDTYDYQTTNRRVQLDPNDNTALKVIVRKDSNLDNYDLVKQRSIMKTLRKLAKNSGIPFTAKSIYESGRMDLIKSLRKEDESLQECIMNNMDLIQEKYNFMKQVKLYIDEFKGYYE